MQGWRAIKAGERLRIGVAGNTRREIAEITAERRERVYLHGDNAAVLSKTHARGGVMVSRLCIGEKRLAARCCPFYRAAQKPRCPNHGRNLSGEKSFDAEAAADVR